MRISIKFQIIRPILKVQAKYHTNQTTRKYQVTSESRNWRSLLNTQMEKSTYQLLIFQICWTNWKKMKMIMNSGPIFPIHKCIRILMMMTNKVFSLSPTIWIREASSQMRREWKLWIPIIRAKIKIWLRAVLAKRKETRKWLDLSLWVHRKRFNEKLIFIQLYYSLKYNK